MKKRKTIIIIIILMLAIGACSLLYVFARSFLHKAELTHRVFPELRSLENILMTYLDENGGLPADETQLIAHGHIRKIHEDTEHNLWEFDGGYLRHEGYFRHLSREPRWYKLYFFEDLSISYGLKYVDMELSGDIVVDKAKKTPMLIINGPGYDKYPEFYQDRTFELYNYMSNNFSWTYNLDLEWTPLHEAIKNNTGKEVESLIKEGVDVNIEAPGLFTPLHVAATYGYVDIAKHLLKSGANINSQDDGGFSALHIAALNGHYDFVKFLIENGADKNLRTKAWRTALDEAEYRSYKDIFILLEKEN